jgi:predicted DNA-binding ribbon-helix-helix protein
MATAQDRPKSRQAYAPMVLKRSIVIAGHKTSVSLEDAFWSGLKEIAARRATTPSALIDEINKKRQHANLSSALRLFVLDFYRSQASDEEPDHRTPETAVRLRSAAKPTSQGDNA